jgi:hypothetical protein
MITLSQENHSVRVQYTYQVQRIRQPPKNKQVNRTEAKTYGLCQSLVRAFDKHGLTEIQGSLTAENPLASLQREGDAYQVRVLDNVQSFESPVEALRDLSRRIKALPLRQRRPLLLVNNLSISFDENAQSDFNADFSNDFN